MAALGFQTTYEGLKLLALNRDTLHNPGFQTTYEGLKLPQPVENLYYNVSAQ